MLYYVQKLKKKRVGENVRRKRQVVFVWSISSIRSRIFILYDSINCVRKKK